MSMEDTPRLVVCAALLSSCKRNLAEMEMEMAGVRTSPQYIMAAERLRLAIGGESLL